MAVGTVSLDWKSVATLAVVAGFFVLAIAL